MMSSLRVVITLKCLIFDRIFFRGEEDARRRGRPRRGRGGHPVVQTFASPGNSRPEPNFYTDIRFTPYSMQTYSPSSVSLHHLDPFSSDSTYHGVPVYPGATPLSSQPNWAMPVRSGGGAPGRVPTTPLPSVGG